jgi:hypothetical protein
MSAESELEKRRVDRDLLFEILIERLAGIIRLTGDEADRQTLRDLIGFSVRGYGWRATLYAPPVFRSKRTPLAHVIALLKRADREALAWALEPDDWNYAMRQRPAALIADLERLEKAARRPWPYPVGPGRPDNYKLLFLVHDLAEKWVILTDRPFTRDWNRVKSRFSLGDQFIEAVVRFLDPKSLPALPKMLERVVEERRQRLPTIHENSEL